MGQLSPQLKTVIDIARDIPDIAPTDDPIEIPVAAIRFTHHTVNTDFAFGEDHKNTQESIFKLFLNLF